MVDVSPEVYKLVRLNRRSLSGMGLTRERWCCTGCWLSRLDMNTCQTSIQTDILLQYFDDPHPGYQILDVTAVGPLPN